MNKEITSSVDTNLMPNGTVVIGNKAFDLAYANDVANEEEISKAIVTGGLVYVKDYDGNWIDNVTGDIVEGSVIPAVVYKSDDKTINFDAVN
ncbi:hypothetical protein KPL37_08710 [Clostridium frigoris]|uniref:Uncharacterized protein n=1 Tax=Clostridium frigoris TaxID=205327 RepID=A0ABS6BSD3_9CLOT|nr:hypothetical protein [Clostridium frigoris]MBU3159831.1 hypothetical protein [Clostridium frigoris]